MAFAAKFFSSIVLYNSSRVGISCATRAFATTGQIPQFRGKLGKVTNVLFDEARSANQIDEAHLQIKQLNDLWIKDFNARIRLQQVDADLSDLKLGDYALATVAALQQSNAIKELRNVCSQFDKAVKMYKNEKHATITVAKQLSKAEEDKLVAQVKGSCCQNGEKLIYNISVNPSIIGGFILSIDDAFIDLSFQPMIEEQQQTVAKELAEAQKKEKEAIDNFFFSWKPRKDIPGYVDWFNKQTKLTEERKLARLDYDGAADTTDYAPNLSQPGLQEYLKKNPDVKKNCVDSDTFWEQLAGDGVQVDRI